MSKSPQQIVTERYGDKTKLIEAVVGLIEAGAGESPEQHKRRLRNVSNAKLLHLVAVGERVKQLGGRDAIVKQILELKRQPKDHEYGDKLRRLSLARIVDLLGSLQRAAKRGTKAAPAAKPAAGGKKAAKAAPKAQTKSR
ncbi:MAG: hypothetical protein K1X88_04720 [Nannocystaceae bacterium]|nr:hypothetical protein [Nannocystaceae bacterium]